MLKNTIRIGFLMILLIFLVGCDYYNTDIRDFETKEFSSERYEFIKKNIRIKKLNKQFKSGGIESFSISESGKIAISLDKNSDISIFNIYDNQGNFQYGYEYSKNGIVGIYWIDDKLAIYSSRGGLVFTIDENNNILNIQKVIDNSRNDEFSSFLQFQNEIVVDNNKYIISKNPGPFPINIITSPSKLVKIEAHGNQTVIFDNYINEHFKDIFITLFFYFFIGVGVSVYMWEHKNYCKK